jgi:16S rRNA (uracil1498-N3)-methyltransferase
MMEHLFYAPDIITNPTLPEEEATHCVRVLRLMEGDQITITDGKGFLYTAILQEAHPKLCRCSITKTIQQDPSWNFNLHLAIAPTKNTERMEWFVEKATEIGVNNITFLRCTHSERREIKLQRIHKIAVSALKQSWQATLPNIHEMTDFDRFISCPFDGQKMFGFCGKEEKKEFLYDCYQTGKNVLILIGPEGDFSQEEIKKAIEAGFTPVSLGPNRLRTETAALVACHSFHLINLMIIK